LGELVADASVTWNGKKPAFPEHLPKLSAGGKPLSTIIQEGRAGFYFATPLRLQSFSSTKSAADKCLKRLNKRPPCEYVKYLKMLTPSILGEPGSSKCGWILQS
jgi:hypothetical protein